MSAARSLVSTNPPRASVIITPTGRLSNVARSLALSPSSPLAFLLSSVTSRKVATLEGLLRYTISLPLTSVSLIVPSRSRSETS